MFEVDWFTGSVHLHPEKAQGQSVTFDTLDQESNIRSLNDSA